MPKSQEWKGYVFALVGTISFSSLYVFSKAGLNQVELAQFGVYYFGLGFLLNLLLSFFSGKLRFRGGISREVIILLAALGIIDILSNVTFFISVNAIPDPSVTSFLGNLFPVFMTVLAITFLKERFSLIEATGAGMAIAGAFVISYSGELDWKKLFIPGTGWVVLNTFFAASVAIIAKKNIGKLSPEIFNLNSNAWIFLFFLGYFLWSDQSLAIPMNAFQNIALGAFFGSFLALLSFFYSYRYISASRSSIVQSLKGIFVLLIAFFYLGQLPVAVQLWGGAITVSGVLIMTLSQAGIIALGNKNKA
jgi:drug/metabolite transporter (DMT)-like permease